MADGALVKPEFTGPPPVKKRAKPVMMIEDTRYYASICAVRRHPGNWAKIARFRTGDRKQRLREAQKAYTQLHRILRRQFPLEHWEVAKIATPDTWFEYEIRVIYLGRFIDRHAADTYRAAAKVAWEQGRKQGKLARETRPKVPVQPRIGAAG
jgi:hypothetical protein